MNPTYRDFHFLGFAKLLFDELPDKPEDDSILGIALGDWREATIKLLAQRAYDLVDYTIMQFDGDALKTITAFAKDVPDFTKWLKEDE